MVVRRRDWERPLVVVLCAAFIAVLQVNYVLYDTRIFAFLGLVRRDIGAFWTIVGFLVALLPAFWMPIRLQRPSMVAYWILYLTVVVPVTWIPFHTLASPPSDYLVYDLVLVACFFLLGLSFRLSRFRVPRPVLPQDTFLFALIVLTVAMTLAVWSTNGFRFDLSVTAMYERRRSWKESIAMGTALNYVKGNLAGAVQPFTFAVGIARGSWPLILLSILAGVVGFSVEGSKTSAAIPLFLLALYPLITKFRKEFGLALPAAATVFVAVVTLCNAFVHEVKIPVLTTWRLFDVKGLLTGYYWEFFSNNPKMYMSDGILRAFVDNPYPYATPEQIGLTYFGSAQTNSNANFWASAFGDFGYPGLVLVTAVLALVFRLIDSMAVNRGYLIPAFLAAFLGMKLSDVALDTSILSHGTLAILVLIYILPPLKKEIADPYTRPATVVRA